MVKKIALVAIILCVLGFIGFRAYKKLVPPKIEPTVVEVEKLTLHDTDNSEIYQGRLISRQSINIQPQVSGVIYDIKARAGDKVQKGQVLVVIDPKKQEALLESYRTQKPALITDLETAKIQYQRYSELYAKKTVSKQELENYKTSYEKAKSALETNEAHIKEQSEQLKYHNIAAPFSGIVGDIPVKIGELVTSGDTLLSVTQNETLELNIRVQAGRVYDLKKGLEVQILDYNDKIVATSHIDFISPKVESGTQTILVKAYFKNPDNILKVNQTVKTKVVYGKTKNLLLPVGSTLHIAGGDFVYIIHEKDGLKYAHQVPVTLGENIDGNFIVKEGLKEGDTVITKGIQKIYEGAPIKIEESEAGE